MGHEVTRESLSELFNVTELKSRAATLVTLTIVTFGDRNILLSVSYQECNHVSSSVGSGLKKKTLSLLSVRNPLQFHWGYLHT